MMALTCACGKCDTSEIERDAGLLELIIKTTTEETTKAVNLLWRSRIQKIDVSNRLDTEFDKLEEIIEEVSLLNGFVGSPSGFGIINDICGCQARIIDLKKELEGLLSSDVEGESEEIEGFGRYL